MTAVRVPNYSRPLRYSEPPPAWPEWRPAPMDFGFADTITINADGLRITAAQPRKTSTENFVGHLDAFLADTDGAFKGRRRRLGSGTSEDGMMDLDQFMDEAMSSDAGQSPAYSDPFPTVRRSDTKFALPAAQPRVSFVSFAPSTAFVRPSSIHQSSFPPPATFYDSLPPPSTTSLTPSSSIGSSTTLRRRASFGGLTAKLFKRSSRAPTPSSLDLDLHLAPLPPTSFFPASEDALPPDISDWLGGLGSRSRSPSVQTTEREGEEDLYMSDSDDAASVPDIVRILNARTELWNGARAERVVLGEPGHQVEFEMVTGL